MAARVIFLAPLLGLLLANIFTAHALDVRSTADRGPLSTLQLRLQPPQKAIVLVGGQSGIQVQCALPTPQYSLRAQPYDPVLVKVISDDVMLNLTAGGDPQGPGSVQLLGLRPGRTSLELLLLHAGNRSVVRVLSWDFEVVVIERLNVLRDGFLYLLMAARVGALFVLAVRMRGAAVKEALKRPCALFYAIFCQTILVPLLSIGVSVALGLPLHTVVCLLILGCCPTGALSPVVAVIQQGHVELAVLVTIIETCAAFGIMPLWLFAYGNFLGLAYDHVSAPYFFIAGALVLVAAPLLMGFIIQKACPGALQQLDGAIPTTCLLLILLEFTVNATGFAAIWDVVTWRLLAGSVLVPILGGILGVVGGAGFQQKLPQSKTMTIVTCVKNTILAKVIIQMSYPVADASVMALTLMCVDFFTVSFMIVTYIPHLGLTLCWPAYRPFHHHAGIGGLQDSIGDRIVRSMVKAGEITFGKLQQSPAFQRVIGADRGTAGHGETGKGRHRDTSNFGSMKGRLMYTGSTVGTLDSAYRSGISLGLSRCTTPSDNANAEFTATLGSLPKTIIIDSLESLDYEMLSEKDYPVTIGGNSQCQVTSEEGGVSAEGEVRETQEEMVVLGAEEEGAATPTPPQLKKAHQCMVPCFDSHDVRKPLPPLPLPPTPPYLTRRISCSDEGGIHRNDPRVLAARPPGSGGQCARMRHVSMTSSKSERSNTTQHTEVSSQQADDDDYGDLTESVSTIMASYDNALVPGQLLSTTSTRWRWDASSAEQYSPWSSLHGVTNDLSSIEEEHSLENKPAV